MTYKQANKRILYDAEDFYLRETKPTERKELQKLFEKHIQLELPERVLSIVAIDKKTGKLIGGILRDMKRMEEHIADGAGLVVLPTYHKKGIGTELVKAMEKKMEENGITYISVRVLSEYAWRIYRKLDYTYDAETKACLKRNGLPEDTFVIGADMVKEFGRPEIHEVREPISEVLDGKQLVGEKEQAGRSIGTKAGTVSVVGEPFGPIGKFTDISAVYHVFLKRTGSPKEEIGRIEVDFEKLGDLDSLDSIGPCEAFRGMDLPETAVIGELFALAPFGKFSLEEVLDSEKKDLVGKGIGTAAVQLTLEDLKRHGVAGVWGRTAEWPAIDLFIRKLEFDGVDSLSFFKKL